MTVNERLESHIERVTESGRWIWTACCTAGGYGVTWANGKKCIAHRVSYELAVGKIPDGLYLDHLCRVRCCVNPSHLEPVTMAENIRRGENCVGAHMRKTHCVHGHEFTDGNTYYRGHQGKYRKCRTCSLEHSRKQVEQRKVRVTND